MSLCTDRAAASLNVRPVAASALSDDARWAPAQAVAALRGVARHHGEAEEILSFHPDRAVGDAYTPSALRLILQRAGVEVVLLPPVPSKADEPAYFRAAAAAFDAPYVPQPPIAQQTPPLTLTGILLEHGGRPAIGLRADERLAEHGVRNIAHNDAPLDLEALWLLPVDTIFYDPDDPTARLLQTLPPPPHARTLVPLPLMPRLCP